MARTKQTARKSTSGKAPRARLHNSSGRFWGQIRCCISQSGKRHNLRSRKAQHAQLPKSHSQDSVCSKITANFRGTEDFPHFVKLPSEIQNRVWEILAEEPRVVAVSTETNMGRRIRSSTPPILHVCSGSRAMGLKHYTLAFEAQTFRDQWWIKDEDKKDPLPGGVYFNFERDTLYLREDWNEQTAAPWRCLSHLVDLVDMSDLRKVTRVGLNVDATVCIMRTSTSTGYVPYLAGWDALEILYLGYEKVRLGSDCPITLSQLESKDYKDFMQLYTMNESWTDGRLLPREFKKFVASLSKDMPFTYHGGQSDRAERKIELVSVEHL